VAVPKPKPPVPAWRWASWFSVLGLALIVFYVLLTPVWLGLRGLAWLADRRART
jgi:hypothetical protein